jgi:hypothetical protein
LLAREVSLEEAKFFDKVIGAVTAGRMIDRRTDTSGSLSDGEICLRS